MNRLKYVLSCICSLFQPKYFIYNGTKLVYKKHPFNFAWANERTIEVPIVWEQIFKTHTYKDILEIGNVMRNYYPHGTWDVVDKYELGTDLFDCVKKYDLIFSISTVEHIENIESALDKIKSLLNPGGKAVITIPLGYRELPNWKMLEVFAERHYMERVSWRNVWKETKFGWSLTYGEKYPAANSVMIGVMNG